MFSGNTTSGESQIRRYMLENDLIEAIIALPTDLFYNTSIGIYAFILSKNKRPERRGKVQLINAVDMYKPLRKSLGKKRKEISRDDIRRITEIYSILKRASSAKYLITKSSCIRNMPSISRFSGGFHLCCEHRGFEVKRIFYRQYSHL